LLMTHFTVIAPPFTSHVRALEALAVGLLAKDHRISWIHPADLRQVPSDPRIEFHPVGAAAHPPGSLALTMARAAHPGGLLGLRRVVADVASATDMLRRESPALLRSLSTEAVIADQMEAAQADALKRAGASWVTGFAPQRAALARADAAVSHAGLNTVSDALAARLVHGGAGLQRLPALASAAGIEKSLRRLLKSPSFSLRAQTLGAYVRQSGGAGQAVGIVEAALRQRPFIQTRDVPHDAPTTAAAGTAR